MGLKTSELIPMPALGPTVLLPSGKPLYQKVFQVSRTDTGSVLKAALPAQAALLSIHQLVGAVSNATLTAAVTFTVTNNTGTVSTGTINELTAGTTQTNANMTNLPTLDGLPATGDLKIFAQYAETGTASSSGGPWNVVVSYLA